MVKNAIKVYARLKPEKNRKHIANYQIHRRPKKNLEEDFLFLFGQQKNDYLDHRPDAWNFSFFHIFEEDATQAHIFENVAQPVVESVLNGYNGTIFAYGQTGSGKTHTISGDQKIYDARGIIPRSLQYLFDVIRKHPENVYSVEVAYLEIYNENGYDLLDRKQRREFAVTRLEDLPRVSIQEDEAGRLHLKNLTFHRVGSEREAFELLLCGDGNRITAETPMNPQSSRSHCIFTIVVSTKQFGADHYRRAKVHLVDLAGSERVYKCAISGTILTEAKHINLSLHYLEQVIVCLGQENTGHIPYRNSLLTSILRDSLGGNCLTTMLATISVSCLNFDETVSTCRFAQRVALIKNDVNVVLDKDVGSENALLRMENERLKQQIAAITKQNISEELTVGEKQNLESQIRTFLESNTTICWDYDPRKVNYCFEFLKANFLLGKDSNSCLKKLEYYKDMVAQRDKEICNIQNNIGDGLKFNNNDRESVSEPKFENAKPAMQSGDNNVDLSHRSVENQANQTPSSDSTALLENLSTIFHVYNEKQSSGKRRVHSSKKHKSRKSKPSNVLQNPNEELSSNSVSCDSKVNLLPCNVVNLTLCESTGDHLKIKDRESNDKSMSLEKPEKNFIRGESQGELREHVNLEKSKSADDSRIWKQRKERAQNLANEYIPETNLQKSTNLNVPRICSENTIENYGHHKSASSTSRKSSREILISSENRKSSTDGSLSTPKYQLQVPAEEFQSFYNKQFEFGGNMSQYDINYGKNKPQKEFQPSIESFNAPKMYKEPRKSNVENMVENLPISHGDHSNRSSINTPKAKTSDSIYDSRDYHGVTENLQVGDVKPECSKTSDYDTIDLDFEKSLPLTGDPEIDEEIIAFYRAKRSGGIY